MPSGSPVSTRAGAVACRVPSPPPTMTQSKAPAPGADGGGDRVLLRVVVLLDRDPACCQDGQGSVDRLPSPAGVLVDQQQRTACSARHALGHDLERVAQGSRISLASMTSSVSVTRLPSHYIIRVRDVDELAMDTPGHADLERDRPFGDVRRELLPRRLLGQTLGRRRRLRWGCRRLGRGLRLEHDGLKVTKGRLRRCGIDPSSIP